MLPTPLIVFSFELCQSKLVQARISFNFHCFDNGQRFIEELLLLENDIAKMQPK